MPKRSSTSSRAARRLRAARRHRPNRQVASPIPQCRPHAEMHAKGPASRPSMPMLVDTTEQALGHRLEPLMRCHRPRAADHEGLRLRAWSRTSSTKPVKLTPGTLRCTNDGGRFCDNAQLRIRAPWHISSQPHFLDVETDPVDIGFPSPWACENDDRAAVGGRARRKKSRSTPVRDGSIVVGDHRQQIFGVAVETATARVNWTSASRSKRHIFRACEAHIHRSSALGAAQRRGARRSPLPRCA